MNETDKKIIRFVIFVILGMTLGFGIAFFIPDRDIGVLVVSLFICAGFTFALLTEKDY